MFLRAILYSSLLFLEEVEMESIYLLSKKIRAYNRSTYRNKLIIYYMDVKDIV